MENTGSNYVWALSNFYNDQYNIYVNFIILYYRAAEGWVQYLYGHQVMADVTMIVVIVTGTPTVYTHYPSVVPQRTARSPGTPRLAPLL